MRKVVTQTLTNGMRLYTQYDSSGSTNLCGVGIKAGSIHNPRVKRGLAHIVEHLISRESRKYSAEQVERLFFTVISREDHNVCTSRPWTLIGTPDLDSKRAMIKAFDLISSMVVNDRIVSKISVDSEKAAVHQEYYLMGKDWLPQLLEDMLFKTMYRSNPAGNQIDGDIQEVEGVTASDVRSFIKRFYVPKNMFVVILGPHHAAAREIAERNLGNWIIPTKPILDYDHSDNMPKLEGIRSLEVERDVSQYYRAIGFPIPIFGHPDSATLEIIRDILNFRVKLRLRTSNSEFNKGVYRCPCVINQSFVHGLFYIWYATLWGDFSREAERIVLEEITKLKTELISDLDLHDFRLSAMRPYMGALTNSAETLCDLVCEAAANTNSGNEMEYINGFRDRFMGVTRRSLRRVAVKYFGRYYVRAIIRPSRIKAG